MIFFSEKVVFFIIIIIIINNTRLLLVLFSPSQSLCSPALVLNLVAATVNVSFRGPGSISGEKKERKILRQREERECYPRKKVSARNFMMKVTRMNRHL